VVACQLNTGNEERLASRKKFSVRLKVAKLLHGKQAVICSRSPCRRKNAPDGTISFGEYLLRFFILQVACFCT
jgi:hypothetical protein